MMQMTLYLLTATVVILFFLMLREKKLTEKLMFLNLIIVKLTLLMMVYSVMQNSQMILDISITFAIIGFLATAVLTRFLMKGGHAK